MSYLECDVCVIGCGSGGLGAATGAAEAGARVAVVERNHLPGGTVVMSWVVNWEPSCGASPLSRRLWERMKSYPLGTFPELEFTTRSKRPGTYEREAKMPFEQWAYLRAVQEELRSHENIELYSGMSFTASRRDGRRVKSVLCQGDGATLEIEAKVFVDASADIVLCREAGCECALGSEARSEYGEPHAPEKADSGDLNEVNWIFRVRPLGRAVAVEKSPIPEDLKTRLGVFLMPMPDGDQVVNLCGRGRYDPSRPESYAKVRREQFEIAYDNYRAHVLFGKGSDWALQGFAPELGIRETYRLKARKVLTENDILSGYARQRERDFIGASDHSLDMHGAGLEQRVRSGAYGVPYGCVQAKEFDNLLVACRGLGVSHIASSSCRLSRILMAIGEGVGRAAALSARTGVLPEDVDASRAAVYEPPA